MRASEPEYIGRRGSIRLLPDNQVPLTYYPDVVENHAELMLQLIDTLPWKRAESNMYGKTFPVPRDEVWVGDKPYVYSRRVYEPQPWSSILLPLKALAEEYAGVQYDSVLLNLYRSGEDKVAWHCDCEPTMSAEHPICSVSLGATRRFQVRAKAKDSTIHTYELASGSIAIMAAGMQQEWLHQVPSQPKITEPRINLTFRVMTG